MDGVLLGLGLAQRMERRDKLIIPSEATTRNIIDKFLGLRTVGWAPVLYCTALFCTYLLYFRSHEGEEVLAQQLGGQLY